MKALGLDKTAGKLYYNRCRDTGRTEYGVLAQLGERKVRNLEVRGSIPLYSTKQGSDEHLFFQRWLRRKVFALIHNRKAPSWE